MKNRVSGIDEARDIIANFHGRKIEVFFNNEWVRYATERIIPMHYPKGDSINDVEVLLKKSRNYYFSISMYLKGKSWVKDVRFCGVNFSARKMKVIHPVPKCDEVWIRTARYINLLKIKVDSQKSKT